MIGFLHFMFALEGKKKRREEMGLEDRGWVWLSEREACQSLVPQAVNNRRVASLSFKRRFVR